MAVEFVISEQFPVPTDELYFAWLDSDLHTKMTGGKAEVSDQVGGEFTAWDGYIKGKNQDLEPTNRILQSWRTSDFDEEDPDSLLEITFIPQGGETMVTIKHSELPEHGMQYHQGWIDAYFSPMRSYFEAKTRD